MTIMKRDYRIRLLVMWIPAGLWMILIFSLSGQSGKASGGLSESVYHILVKVTDWFGITGMEQMKDLSTLIIRKGAHFSEYFLLGVFVYHAMKERKIERRYQLLYSIAVCIFYSVSDEIHQYFTPGRACRVLDVIIDSSGAVVGIFAFRWIYEKWIRRKVR